MTVRPTIPYGRQHIGDSDIRAVTDVLRSDFLTQGPAVPRFEQAVATYCGVPHAVAAHSATSALHLACLALDVGAGDRVWTSSVTFVATANCAMYCGAGVDFVDIDSRTGNLSVTCLEQKLAGAPPAMRPKVVIAVHLCGQSCDMEGIAALARRYGFKVIEDASHAIGATSRGERVGGCRHSDICVFSFHPVKIITTAEGGLAVTRDARLARRMRLFGSHGITRDPAEMTHASDGPWYYEQIALGFNYRMSDLQAALGTSQMERIDNFIAQRRQIAARYDEELRGLPLTPLLQEAHGTSALHLYVIRLRRAEIRRGHREVFEALRAAGIGVNVHYIPVYRQPFYHRLGFPAGYCPAAENYYAEAISLPIYVGLTAAEQTEVIRALHAVVIT